MVKFISDIIKEEDIDSWKDGERILICSQTGSGKSQFIKDNLYEYCKNKNKKILLLSNRNLLKKQNLISLSGREGIDVRNYQGLESQYLYGKTLQELFEPYQVIVYDEAHYAFSDSNFNRNTDALIRPILDTPKDKIFIFLTATPQALLHYQNNFDHIYDLPQDYSYIKDIYFFNKPEIVDLIIKKLPPEEKLIFFSSDALDAYSIAMENPTISTFLCSEYHKELAKKSSMSTFTEIAEKQQFSSQVLCATKILDNGISIHDPSVKHVAIDMLDPISFIQCLGRKRITGDDSITLYVLNYYYGRVVSTQTINNIKLNQIKELENIGEIEFRDKYKKKDFDNVIQNDYTINEAKRIFLEVYKENLDIMALDRTDGYKRLICKLLSFPFEKIKNAEQYFEKLKLGEEVEKFANRRLFKNEQENLKHMIFDSLYEPMNKNYHRLGLHSFNEIMRDHKLPFYITFGIDNSKEHRKQHYWFITKVNM